MQEVVGSNPTEGKICFSHFTLLEWNVKNCFVKLIKTLKVVFKPVHINKKKLRKLCILRASKYFKQILLQFHYSFFNKFKSYLFEPNIIKLSTYLIHSLIIWLHLMRTYGYLLYLCRNTVHYIQSRRAKLLPNQLHHWFN